MRIELELEAHAFGQVAMAKFVLLIEGHPTVATLIVDDEFIGGRFDPYAEIPALQQRALMQQADQAFDAPALLVKLSVASGGADRQHGERDDDGHDHDHHQDLDQREALAAHAQDTAVRSAYLCSSVEVLMSAS